MPRIITFPVVADTSYFTPLQLQPRTAFALAWNGLARWLKQHLVSFPVLIGERQAGVVVLTVNLAYEAPLSFAESDGLQASVGLKVLRGGTRLQCNLDLTAGERRVATVRLLLCPVRIGDPMSLGAEVARLDEALLALFQPDEVDSASPARTVPPLSAAIEADGRLIATTQYQFIVHRHRCEIADQWWFGELPTITEAAREPLALMRHEDEPVLRQALAQPLTHFDAEFTQPYFWLQQGVLDVRAYEYQGRLAILYRLLSAGDQSHGIAIERY
jgi:hypothetical protein